MINQQKQLIIFCQAPADVQYVLSLYEKYHQDYEISVFVINLEGIYSYFKSLHLNLKDLILIPYPENVPLKNLLKLIRIKNRLDEDFRKYFKPIQGQTVYFFSRYFDWLTAFYISGISEYNKVYLIDHSGHTFTGTKEISGPLITYRKLVYKYLTTVRFRFLKMQSANMIEFPVENYPVEIAKYNPDLAVIKKYSVKTETGSSKSVLLFESNQSAYDFYTDYETRMTEIAELFKKSGYKLYIKPHPRQGFSQFLKPYAEKIVPAEISGEFYNADDFSLIAGVDSNAIAFFAKNYQSKTISLLELFSFRREEEKERFRKTQLNLSDGKIYFIKSISDFENLIFKNR